MKWIRRLSPYAIAVALIVVLLLQIDPTQVVRLLVNVDWRWLLAAVGAYVFTNLVRAFRFNALLELHAAPWLSRTPGPVAGTPPGGPNATRDVGGTIAAVQLLPEMFALSFLNNTLPARSGELSFPYFMWRRHKIAVGTSSAALIVVRVFDYIAVAILYLVCASANLHRLAVNATSVLGVVGFVLVLSLAALLAAPWFGQELLDGLRSLTRRLGLGERRAVRVLLSVGGQAVDHLQRIRTVRAYVTTLAWSLLTWIGTFAWFAASMQGIGVGQPFGLVIVGATFASLAKAVPFITVGGFGAHEAGWTVGFSLVGMSVATAIASGFAVNILTLLMSVVFGGTALVFMQAQEKWCARAAEEEQSTQTLMATGPWPDDRTTP